MASAELGTSVRDFWRLRFRAPADRPSSDAQSKLKKLEEAAAAGANGDGCWWLVALMF